MNRNVLRHLPLLALACLGVFAQPTLAQDQPRAYTEGVVVEVAYIRTKPGMFDEYLRYLGGNYKKLMDEYKKQGLIESWGVYAATPRSSKDPDLVLTTVFKNMAALDGLQDKMDPVEKGIWGTMTKANQAAIDRGSQREQLGSELLRKLEFK